MFLPENITQTIPAVTGIRAPIAASFDTLEHSFTSYPRAFNQRSFDRSFEQESPFLNNSSIGIQSDDDDDDNFNVSSTSNAPESLQHSDKASRLQAMFT